MRSTAAVLLATMVVLAGCGGGGDSGGGSSSFGTSADKVVSVFKAKTGVTLRKIDDDETWADLVPPPDDAAAIAKYGPFSIYVTKSADGEKILLDGAEPVDGTGVAWKAAGAGQYLGTKRYGKNVFLQFSPDRPGKRFDQKFQLLDAALSGL
jgi:hypothetical protein